MPYFCLDTNTCIDAMKGLAPGVPARLSDLSPDEIGIPSLVKAELILGGLKSGNSKSVLEVVRRFLAPFPVLAFGGREAEHYAEIRRDLESRGKSIGPNDLIIAAVARAWGSILITHNTREFSRVPGLRIEDWHDLPF